MNLGNLAYYIINRHPLLQGKFEIQGKLRDNVDRFLENNKSKLVMNYE
jgi:hypothetical protein